MKFHVVISTVYEVEAASESAAIKWMGQHQWPLPMLAGVTEVYDSTKPYTLNFREPVEAIGNE